MINKKYLSKLLTMFTLGVCLYSTSISFGQERILLGDINNDKVIDKTDLTYMESISKMDEYGDDWEPFIPRVDLDFDGVITEKDINIMKDYLDGKIESFSKTYVGEEELENKEQDKEQHKEEDKEQDKEQDKEGRILFGDINEDQVIDYKDLGHVKSFANKTEYREDLKLYVHRADLDGDEVVTDKDIKLMEDYLDGKINSFYKKYADKEENIEENKETNEEQTKKENIEVVDERNRVLLGDENNDKAIDEIDLWNVKQYIKCDEYLDDWKMYIRRVDLDGDKKITQKDVELMEDYLDGRIESFYTKYAENQDTNKEKDYGGSLRVLVHEENEILDMDEDNVITLKDLGILEGVKAGPRGVDYKDKFEKYKDKCDINVDGKVDKEDLKIMRLYITKKIEIPSSEEVEKYCRENPPKISAHEKLKNGILNFEEGVSLEEYPEIGYSEMYKLMDEVLTDNPKIQILVEGISYGSNRSEYYVIARVEYRRSQKETRKVEKLLNDKMDEILDEIITNDMSEYEKIVAVHDYITKNTKYNDQWFIDGAPGESHSPYGVLIDRVAVCDGFSGTMKMMLDKLGIESKVVYGASRAGGHAWNLVKLGDKYYHVDITNSIYGYGNTKSIPREYIFITDEIIKNECGYRWNENFYPKANDISQNAYLKEFEEAKSIEEVYSQINKAIENNKENTTILCKGFSIGEDEVYKFLIEKNLLNINCKINDSKHNLFKKYLDNAYILDLEISNSNKIDKVSSMEEFAQYVRQAIKNGESKISVFYANSDANYSSIRKIMTSENQKQAKVMINNSHRENNYSKSIELLRNDNIEGFEDCFVVDIEDIDPSKKGFLDTVIKISDKETFKNEVEKFVTSRDKTCLIYCEDFEITDEDFFNMFKEKFYKEKITFPSIRIINGEKHTGLNRLKDSCVIELNK